MPDLRKKCSNELARLRAEVKGLRARIRRLSPGLGTLLKRRRFYIYKKEPSEKLFIPSKRQVDRFYHMMRKYSFRLFLRDVIKYGSFSVHDVTRYATPSVTKAYCQFLLTLKLIRRTPQGFAQVKKRISSFGETLEWYVAEIFRREFDAEAVWGVKFRRPRVGGDYDVIAQVDNALFYIEVKSSPPKQIYDSEIAAFLDRVDDLAPEIAVFLMDTELRMKDKIVPMFEKELEKRFDQAPPVLRMQRELFGIEDRIFIINSKEELLENLGLVLARSYHMHILRR